MNEAILVQKVDSSNCLYEEVKCSLFCETAFFFDEHKKITFCYIFHHQINKLMILEVSVHSNNINMLELFVDLNLSAQRFSHLLCFNHAFVEFFNGNF